MAVKVKTIPEKPEWFDLENYKKSKTSDLQQWIWNITPRIFGYRALFYSKTDKIMYDEVKTGVENSRKYGFKIFQKTPHGSLNDQEYRRTLSVYTLNVTDVGIALHEKDEDIKKKIINYLDGQYDGESEHPGEIKLGSTVDDIYGYAAVNLNISLEASLKDFKSWLIKQKKEHGNIDRKKITPEDMRIWRDCRVLQYIDMLIWHKQKNIKTPATHILGSWIFPEEKIDGTAKLNDATKKISKKLMSWRYFDYLTDQVRLEPNKK